MFSESALIAHVIDFNLDPNGTFTFQTVFCWDASLCVVCDGYHRVEVTCQAHLQGAFFPEDGAAGSSETLLAICQTTRHHIAGGRYENGISHTVHFC